MDRNDELEWSNKTICLPFSGLSHELEFLKQQEIIKAIILFFMRFYKSTSALLFIV